GHKQLPVKIILMKKTCQRRSSLRSRCMVQPEETLPIKHHHRQDGTKLYDECKRLDKFCTFHTQDVLRDNHVSRRRHWQELSQLFYTSDDNRFPSCSISHSSSYSSLLS